MKRLFPILAAAGALAATAQAPAGIADVVKGLEALDCYRATVDYSVTLPQAEDDVRYTIGLESSAADATDTLSPVDYVIDWRFRAPSGADVSGFSAYYDGHHYRYRGDRLQEYHTEWDPAPFASRRSGGHTFAGVQRGVQFANLLPGFIALDLKEMAADTLFTLTMPAAPEGRVKIKAVMTLGGVECMESVYTFALPSMLPLTIATETNTGSLAEQSLTARYTYADTVPPAPCPTVNEEELRRRWPEVFEKFRESNFRIENLPGSPLPAFSLPRPDGNRLTRTRGQEFAAPAAIVIIDPAHQFAAATVEAVREAASRLPYEPEVLWAVASTNPDSARDLAGTLRPGEALAFNAAPLARDCGAASLPVVVICSTDGKVADVVLGYNNSLASVVMQKMSILK